MIQNISLLPSKGENMDSNKDNCVSFERAFKRLRVREDGDFMTRQVDQSRQVNLTNKLIKRVDQLIYLLSFPEQ